jgi:hypothetical protein
MWLFLRVCTRRLRRGVSDLVDLLLLSLSEKLGLNPGDEAGFRLELAERYLEEAVTEVAISLNICEYF